MLDALHEYLKDAATPETYLEIQNAHAVFDRLGMDSYDEGFLELLMVDDEVDNGVTLTSVVNLTRHLLTAVLGQHGVTVVAETSMQRLTELVTVLLDIPDWEDQHGLLVIAQQIKSPVECFAELVEVVSTHSADDILVSLDGVSDSLLRKIASLCAQKLIDEDEEDVMTFRNERLGGYRAFVDQQQLQNTRIQTLVANGMDAGYPFRLYCDQIGRDVEALPVPDAARELVAMALLSSDGHTSPDAVITPELEFLIADADVRTKVLVAVRDLIFKLPRNE